MTSVHAHPSPSARHFSPYLPSSLGGFSRFSSRLYKYICCRRWRRRRWRTLRASSAPPSWGSRRALIEEEGGGGGGKTKAHCSRPVWSLFLFRAPRCVSARWQDRHQPLPPRPPPTSPPPQSNRPPPPTCAAGHHRHRGRRAADAGGVHGEPGRGRRGAAGRWEARNLC